MSSCKVELNSEAVRDLLRSDEMQAICKEKASEIIRRAGGSYETSVHVGKNRCNVSISTNDRKTMQDNLSNNTLLKSLRG